MSGSGEARKRSGGARQISATGKRLGRINTHRSAWSRESHMIHTRLIAALTALALAAVRLAAPAALARSASSANDGAGRAGVQQAAAGQAAIVIAAAATDSVMLRD